MLTNNKRMNNYLTVYHENLICLLSDKIKDLYKDPLIKKLYETFYDIFPCDDKTNLVEVVVLLYFHNEGLINEAHRYLFDEHIVKALSFKVVNFIVVNAKKKYQKKIDQIKRFSLTPIQSREMNKLKKLAEKCILEIEKVEENMKTNESFYKRRFKGKFQISKPIGPRSARKSIREMLPKNITNKEKLEFMSRYDSSIYELRRFYEVWEQIIHEECPDKVCIGNTAYLITNDTNSDKLTGTELEKKTKIILERRNKYSMEPDQYLSIPIREIENCNLPIFVCTLGLNYDNTFIGHANGLVFLLDKKEIYRLEPNGVDLYNDGVIEDEIKKFYPELNDFEYHGTLKTCPYSPAGVQLIESFSNIVKIPKEEGYCFIWSLILMHYAIEYYPEFSPDQMQNYLIHNVELNDLFSGFIIKIIKKYHQLIDENYPFINTESYNSFKMDPNVNFHHSIFDISDESHIDRLYHGITSGIHFDTIVYEFFNLSQNVLLTKIYFNNMKKFLIALETGSLYFALRTINETDNKHMRIADEFLPRSIYYYKDMIKKSFEEYIERTRDYDHNGMYMLKKLYFLFFDLKYCLI